VAGLLAVAIAGVTSCAATMVNAYLPSGASLQPYRTFAWAAEADGATGDPRLDNNEIFDRHVRRGVETQLRRHGFALQTPDLADLLVHYHASVSQKIDVRELNQDAILDHNNQDTPQTVFDEGTLVVDLVDARTRKLLWRGWVEGRLDGVIDDQRLMERYVDDALEMLFKRLPSGTSSESRLR
jgi:hypothetical protein